MAGELGKRILQVIAMQQAEFDLEEGRRRKRQGMSLAAQNRARLLDYARRLAREIAQKSGVCTSDDVHKALRERGLDGLGNAAGSLFRGPEWVFTGQWRPSERVSAHGRMIRVWRLRDVQM